MRTSLFDHLFARNGVFQDEVFLLTDPSASKAFEGSYFAVRAAEQRHFPDHDLPKLPEVNEQHPHFAEWQLRRQTCLDLLTYLRNKRRLLTFLDLGCGNGWLSNCLTNLPGAIVCAVDLNMIELEQGARVFADNLQVQFCYADIFEPVFHPGRFDIIILNSVIQYFPDLPRLLTQLRELLTADGEIHILDSNLYSENSLEAARQRTASYYQDLGLPEMIPYYYHHLMKDVKPFSPQNLYHPRRRWQRFLTARGERSPFPWLRIKG